MRMRIRIRLNVLSASIGRDIIPRGGTGTAMVDGAVPPASSRMLRVLVMRRMLVGIMPAFAVRRL